MIFGVGTDIVHVPRMEKSLSRFGRRFAQRILADVELPGFDASRSQSNFIAKRFAIKEAVAKAFGTGFRDGLHLTHIGIVNDQLGRPELVFFERAKRFVDEQGITAGYVSVADERDYAVAFVTLVR